ncbi:class F sortase [Umezawaea beigongshangensis]|uniref:class F sortase n=1 Tax=Umezawaea beigongshangensis TaxID=2780383 RepID=UPI001E5C2520
MNFVLPSIGTASAATGKRVALVALLLLAVVLTGCSATGGAPPAASTGTAAGTTSVAAEPAELRIPSLDVRSSLVPLGLNPDQTVQVPPVEQPLQAGWFRGAPAPGATGPAIVLGHVDGNDQPGIFHRLHELREGDRVEVSAVNGTTVGFAVREVRRVPKAEFPTEDVYGDTTGPEIRLITCGGVFDHAAGSYLDNVIVFGTMI